MNTLLERLRAALAPDYLVIEEIARGGMGVVFLGRDTTLHRRVAIKVVLPEAATAAATERFLREARILASFNHPNIVPVHRAGESDGLAWYAMAYVEGVPLSRHLQSRAVTQRDALRITDDLLAAVEAIHKAGIIHRDIKPANILLVDGRAMLTDFGIAKDTASNETALTQAGHVVGTPAYMPPEQQAGDASALTDQCAAAMVVYEMFTGRPWTFDHRSDGADWSALPEPVAAATRRALAWSPAERWPSAADYRAALAGRAARRPRRQTARAAMWLAAMLLVVWSVGLALRPRVGGPLRVRIQALESPGADAQGDSVAAALRAALRNAADITFTDAPGLIVNRPDMTVSGLVRPEPGGLGAELIVRDREDRLLFTVRAAGPPASLVDTLAVRLLHRLITAERGSLPGDMPASALPHTTAALGMLATAEAMYARADWSAADLAYQAALAADTTCLLCVYRLSIIARWQRRDGDAAQSARLRSRLEAFPLHYRMVIEAGFATDRWERLEELRERASESDLAQFIYADEVFHRGPLAGYQRASARQHFQSTVHARPGFAPAWEHLAMAATADGDSVMADSALRRFQQTMSARDLTSQALLAVNQTGFHWRFRPPAHAAAATDQLLDAMAAFPDLVHGARYLMAFDAPLGVLHVGRRFEQWPGRTELVIPGLSSQIAAFIAMGQIDSARAAMRRLRGHSADAELTLAALGYETALTLMDSLDARAMLVSARHALEPLTREGAATAAQRRRAAFFLTLLARRAGEDARGRIWRRLVGADSGSGALAALLDADSAAAIAPRRGLAVSEPLLSLDSAGRGGDPFVRALLHGLRGQWQLSAGNRLQAARALRWHENFDFLGGPTTAAVQPLEAD